MQAMEIRTSYNKTSHLLNPQRWTKEKGELSAVGTVAAVALSAYSKFSEALYYTGLTVEALINEQNHLPLSDEIAQLDQMRRGLKSFHRVHTTSNLPLGETNPLKDLPKAEISKPVLLVPGWDTPHDRFSPLTDKLTEDGANGGQPYYLQNGEFFADRDCNVPTEVPKDAKVFVTVFHSTSESPHTTAPQLAANLQAMARVTGEKKPDVMAFSQGGLATRTYLGQNEENQIGKILFVGTPNLGAGLASLCNFVYQLADRDFDVDYLMHTQGLDPEDRQSIEFMTVGGPDLEALNANWDSQMAKTDGFAIVGHKGTPTFHFGTPPWSPGDSLVEATHLGPENVERTYVEGDWAKHGTLPFNAGTYQKMHQHFGWAATTA